MARPQFVGGQVASSVGGSGTGTLTFNLTGGLAATPAAGDLVLIAVGHGGSTNQDLAIDGYTEIVDLFTDDYNANNFGLFYKFMGATPDTTAQVPYSQDTAEGSAYVVHVWRGVDPVTPFDVTAVTASGINTALPNPAAITPQTADAVIIVAGSGSTASGAAFTSSDLSNFRSTFGNDTYDTAVGMGSYDWTSGTFDPVTWGGIGANTNDSWSAVTIALRPPIKEASAAVSASGSASASAGAVRVSAVSLAASAFVAAAPHIAGSPFDGAVFDADVFDTGAYEVMAAATASASLAASATRLKLGSAALTASASLSSARGAVRGTAASRAATATFAATSERIRQRTVTLAAAGSVSAQRAVTRGGSAALVGSGATASSAARTRNRTAALPASGLVGSVASRIALRTSAVAGGGVLAALGVRAANVFLRPISDVAANGWTAVNAASLSAALDEEAVDDADFILSPSNPAGEACELGIGGEDIMLPISIRYRAVTQGGATTITIKIMEGAVERAARSRILTDDLTDYEDFLTAEEIAAVSNWSNVTIRISAV